MSLHKLTAGSGYTYLTRQVAAQDTDSVGYSGLGEYYAQKGESPGQWMGRGGRGVSDFPQATTVSEAQMCALFGEGRHPEADRISAELARSGHDASAIEAATRLGAPFRVYDKAPEFRRVLAERFAAWNTTAGLPADWPIPAAERARIRTEAATEMFTERFGRPPADARELSGLVARESRQATTAVAGYDLTFSPVKSVSTLWAVAPMDLARRIEAAHDAAVADTLAWLEDNATYTRSGRNGVQQVEVHGLIAAAFTHRDSRAGDPDLHTHVAISNKVQSLDGRWLALDGRPMHKMTVAASERYNTRLEAHLVDALGVAFAERAGTDPGKRPIREIIGVDSDLAAGWSSRRAEIDTRRAELSAKFQADHGRTPNVVEALRLAQQATLDTREAKHEPRSYADQRAAWQTQAVNAMGSIDAVQEMVQRVVNPSAADRTVTPFSQQWAEQTAAEASDAVALTRATWQEPHLRAEAERRARAAGIPLTELDRAVDATVDAALSPALAIPLGTPSDIVEPAALRRSDGMSVYSTARTQLYTSPAIVEAERTLTALAGERGGHVVPTATVDLALLESTANGVDLNPGQVQLVRDMATSGASLQLALAPAGTGKTTAMRVLSRAWTSDGGTVLGLAPSAAAAAVLKDEIGGHTDTLAKLNHSLATGVLPTWVDEIGPKTLVILDEAGMAGTTELASAVTYIHGRGGSVRLIGDDQQLAAIGAGGVLRDIAETAGAVTLSQVMRFNDTAEGAASLALRAGDTAAIGYYLDNTRVHVGDAGTVTDQAYQAWTADRRAGRDSVMLAPTRDLVAELNGRARRDRLDLEGIASREVQLTDGSAASAGDVVITRRNDRRLPITATDWVKNGDRWTVLNVAADGSLQVRHLGTNRTLTLPASYVAEHVALGYASTVHAAQGITADTSHTVATGEESRQVAYVALTRGRIGNHLYLTTAGDGDDHSVITRDALLPPTAADIFARILQRDGAQTSATTAQRELDNPSRLLQAAADQYADALHYAAEAHLGEQAMASIDAAAEHALPGLTGAPAYPTLRGHLALLSLSGQDPLTALTSAVEYRELDTADDVAAVLDWRLDPTLGHSAPRGPLPWLPGVPDRLDEDPGWGRYLQHRAAEVVDLAATVATAAAQWTPTSAPAWAAPLVDVENAAGTNASGGGYRSGQRLISDLAVWRAATGADDGDLRTTGETQIRAAETRHQRSLGKRAAAVLGAPNAATNAWANTANVVDRRITADPYWPTLAGRLAAANRAGLDVEQLVAAAGEEGPLPDEHPAAALWWRLSRHLAPAALNATASTSPATLRPEWTPVLADVVGPQLAARVLADAAWPGLVAAVEKAGEAGWNADSVLSTAHELLLAGQDHAPVAGHELATALTWRIAMLAEANSFAHATGGSPSSTGPLAEPPDLLSPEDLLTGGEHGGSAPPPYDDSPEPADLVSVEDEQWLASVDWTTEPAVILNANDVADTDVAQATEPRRLEDRTRAAAAARPVPGGDEWPWRPVAPARIADLNEQALAFFIEHYTDGWAADYLTDRLGSDLVEDDRFHPGYAPAGWTNLTDHLRAAGAIDEELLAAGLATEAKTGRLIDRFRDRLVLPIYNGDQVHGFVGRRNPATDDAGPKYLNTADTALFTKGNQLFGATEGAAALAAGATPVVLEGPLDAIAVTLAGEGRYVGLAPLGTAFTDTQADSLATGSDRPQPLVATDGDNAGRKAAERAYWLLTERGHHPNHTPMPADLDPAQVLMQHGPDTLRQMLDNHHPLATTLIDARINAHHDHLNTPEGTVAAGRAAAQVIAALPPQSWQHHIDHVVDRIAPTPGWLHLEVFEAGQQWSDDPHAATRNRLNSKDYSDHHTPPPPLHDPATTAAASAADWTNLARAAHPALLTDPGWPLLVDAMRRAQADGYDVTTHLPELVEQAPLPATNPAQVLRYRLINQSAAAMTPLSDATRHAAETADAHAAAERLARPIPPPPSAPTATLDLALRADRAASDAARARLDATHNQEPRTGAAAPTKPIATPAPSQPDPPAPPPTPGRPQDPGAPRR